MNDPNAQTRKHQTLLVGGAVAGILVLMLAGMFFFDSGPTRRHEKPKSVTITAPGSVDDKDAWRAQQSAKDKANETQISEVRSLLKSQEEQTRKLSLEMQELKAGKAAGTPPNAKADAAVRFAVKVVRERGRVSDADVKAVKAAGYDDAQIVEIVQHVALNTWTNYINLVAETEIDFPVIEARKAA